MGQGLTKVFHTRCSTGDELGWLPKNVGSSFLIKSCLNDVKGDDACKSKALNEHNQIKS